LTAKITTAEKAAVVSAYVKAAALKSDLDRTDLAREKTGVFTGSFAINPVNHERIPVWIADYVLTGYGTGAIMAVPAHDTRDFEFAQTFGLPIRPIMDPKDAEHEIRDLVLQGKAPWIEDGIYIHSSNENTSLSIDGMNKEKGIATVNKWLEDKGIGAATVTYKLRDWLFSRQRYWGEPFPVIHWEDGTISILPDEELPLELPELEKYQPGEDGDSPLANAQGWLSVTDSYGRKGRRETNTMPQWAGSCWYYLRFLDPHNDHEPFSSAMEKYWMPVDLYIGGAEHAVLHLLYSRFWHKVLYDLNIVSTDEPYMKLFNQGMIFAFAYESSTGAKIPSDLVREKDGNFLHKTTGEELSQIVAKMSKSLKNVINPDDVVATYGADSLRLYEMFMGPLDTTKPWSEQGVKGVFNFLGRVSRFFGDKSHIVMGEEQTDTLKQLHETIKKVQNDIEELKFNTAISQMMIFNNHCMKKGIISEDTALTYILIIAPFAPHLAEELWELYGKEPSVSEQPWPEYREEYLLEDTFEYPVAFNGKLRFRIELSLSMDAGQVEQAVIKHESAKKWLGGKAPQKVIVVPGKIVNIVI